MKKNMHFILLFVALALQTQLYSQGGATAKANGDGSFDVTISKVGIADKDPSLSVATLLSSSIEAKSESTISDIFAYYHFTHFV